MNNDLYHYIPQTMVGIVQSPYYWNEKTQNCFMTSPKYHIFWFDEFVKLIQNVNQKEVLHATGLQLMDGAVSYSKEEVYILPCENFQRVPLGEYDETLWTTVLDREMMF